MSQQPTYYELLGVSHTASADELRAAYRGVVRQVHPDSGGNAGLFVVVHAAWEALSDSSRRHAYDLAMGLAVPRSAPSPERSSSRAGSTRSGSRPTDNDDGDLPVLDEAWGTFLEQYAEGTVDAQELWDAVDDFSAGRRLGWLKGRRMRGRLGREDAELLRRQAREVALLLRRFLSNRIDGDELAGEAMDVLGLS